MAPSFAWLHVIPMLHTDLHNRALAAVRMALSALMLAGCATVSMTEYQDASSLGGGKIAVTAGIPVGASQSVLSAYRSGPSPGALSAIELGAGMGVGARNDIGIGVWSGMGLLTLLTGIYDYGGKLNWKLMLTDIESPHKIALSSTLLGYRARGNDDKFNVHYDIRMAGLTTALIYSYHPDYESGFHTKLKYGRFIFSDRLGAFPYHAEHTPEWHTTDVITPSIGCSMAMARDALVGDIGADLRGYAEVAVYMARYSNKPGSRFEWGGLSSAVGVIFLFGGN